MSQTNGLRHLVPQRMKCSDYLRWLVAFGFSFAATGPVALNAADSTRTFGIGLSGGIQPKDYDQRIRLLQFTPEIFGYAYLPLGNEFLLRPAVRLGYAGGQENDAIPSAITLEEHDYKGMIEASIIYCGLSWFYPALGVGGGTILRHNSLLTARPIASADSRLSGNTFYPLLYGQASLIFSIQADHYEVAPYVRYNHVFDDDRLRWQFGLEFSLGWGS